MVGRKTYRSKEFMSFIHNNMRGECCVCRERPWQQLHHFGRGAMGMKPSDAELCRLCRECAQANEVKKLAMKRDGRWELLATMQEDALEMNEEWLRYLAEKEKVPSRCRQCHHMQKGICKASLCHIEPPNDCAMDELNMWLVTEGMGMSPDQQSKWLAKWSNRRSANVIGFLTEAMKEIVKIKNEEEEEDLEIGEYTQSVRFVAMQALKVAGVDVV